MRLGVRRAATCALTLTCIGLLAGASQSATPHARGPLTSVTEVWQKAEHAYDENPSNPLADRVWGVYQGPQDQVSGPFLSSHGTRQALLSKIGLRPRTKWYGAFVADDRIRSTVQSYIATSQAGDPDKLVQIAVFRMKPWEQEACERRSTPAEKRSYRRWINQLAAGIAGTPMLVVMQPDGPFLWCTPDKGAKSKLLTWATQKLSALSRTSVYIDAGAADWCENGAGADPERCAQILERTGIEYARGFALDSTHYTGPADNIEHGARIAAALQRDGYGVKHFIIDTAKSGRPTMWEDMVPATKKDLKDNARVCKTQVQTRCVTLGIPPTVRTADPKWLLSSDDRALARRYVDGFVWFGRPWLYNQADPFVLKRALTMARSTPYPGPLITVP
ncbi:glycoside hydrolase family 6 protein [Nocardioides conyzicola]|uniref:Glucanase n=1 Tax=Nocardioides conyzicola TaxID=1651781 RepID=A0ABP8WXZ3_9ACTN